MKSQWVWLILFGVFILAACEPLTPVLTTKIQHNQECWEIKPLEEKSTPSGDLVYLDISQSADKKDNLHYWDILSNQSFSLKIDSELNILSGRVISPDGKSIARLSDNGLAIISADRVEYFQIPPKTLLNGYLPDGKIWDFKIRWKETTNARNIRFTISAN